MTVDLSWLKDRRCESVALDVSGSLFCFGDDATLQIGCAWRIVVAGRIALGSVDHAQRFGLPSPVDAAVEAPEILGQRRVQHIHVAEQFGDLTLDFGDGVRLEIWNGSSGYEGWTAVGPAGRRIVAMGGGELIIWS